MVELEESMNSDMRNISRYMSLNKLTLNAEKTIYMLFTGTTSAMNLNLTCNGSKIENSLAHKHLGLIIDSKLTWKPHIKHLKSKLVPLTGVFRRISGSLPFEARKQLFYALFHSHILYGITIWGNSSDENIIKIQKLQNRALKNLFKLNFRTSTIKLHAELKILPIKDIYFKFSTLHINNIINHKVLSNIDLSTKKLSTRPLRSDNLLRNIKVATTKFGLNGALFGAIKNFNVFQKDFHPKERNIKESIHRGLLQKLINNNV